jgi:hypothetical protein
MKSKIRFIFRSAGSESGSALIIVLVLMVLGSLVMLPALANIGTVLDTGARYESKTNALYAADAGIEDGICQIKNDQLPYVLAGQDYSRYSYGTSWSYDLSQPVNRLETTVTIENVWIPRQDADTEIEPPSDPAEVAAVMGLNKLMVSGTAEDTSHYEINISFTPEAGDNLTIKSIGVWLPYGFGYVPHSSNLEDNVYAPYYAVPDVFEHDGGYGVVWDFPFQPSIDVFPNYAFSGGVQTTRIAFSYTANETGTRPAAIAWMVTDDYLSIQDILPVTWDIDTSVYKITSSAGGAEVEAYISRNELRSMEDAIAGDYIATGNSLMRNLDGDSYGIRDNLLPESSATVSSINATAVVTGAYLYWAAWFDEHKVLDEHCSNFSDNAWVRTTTPSPGSAWSANGNYNGHSTVPEGDPRRYLTSKTLDLSGLNPASVVEVRWDQSESGTLETDQDELQYQFYGNGQWSQMFTAFNGNIDETSERFSTNIPQTYWANDFKLRIYLKGFTETAGTDEYAHLDDIAVTWYVSTADASAKFKINGVQVYLDANGDPQQGLQELTASSSEQGFVDNLRGYSYRIKKDVTKLVQAYTPNGSPEHLCGNGNATYTVGNVQGDLNDQLAWGGWSLIIIYASPETAGHRIYLFDRFAFDRGYENMDFDFDGSPGGDISGFLVPDIIVGDPDSYAGHMTCFVGEGDNFITGDKVKFTGQSGNSMYLSNSVSPWYNVWNMQSPGMTFDGVDVDSFNIPWKNGGQDLVVPGDTTAHLDLPSEKAGGYMGSDAWNLVYLILSLRSKTTTSGTSHYVIRN